MPAKPQLQSCKEMHRYRDRSTQESELIRLADPSTAAVRARLVSLKSKDIAKLIFHNQHNEPVRALWLDFDGHEVEHLPRKQWHDCCLLSFTISVQHGVLQVAYSTLGPGTRKTYSNARQALLARQIFIHIAAKDMCLAGI